MTSPVVLNVYDLSNGMARQFSPMLLGRPIDGVWHTGIVAFGVEFYFGGGICADAPAATPYGVPVRTEPLGRTARTRPQFDAFLASVAPRFSMATYHLLDNNCNNFTDACARFLLGPDTGIPRYIIDLPRDAMDSPLGPMLRPMLDQMQASIRDQSLGHEVALAAPPAGLAPAPAPAPAAPSATVLRAARPVVLARADVAVVLRKLHDVDARFDAPRAGADAAPPPVPALLAAARRARPGDAFPALDLLRVAAARSPRDCDLAAAALPDLLRAHVLDPAAPRPDRMMALRVAVNAFAHPDAQAAVCAPGAVETVVEAAVHALESDHPAVVKTGATLALNLAGAPHRAPGKVPKLAEELVVRLLFAAVDLANKPTTPSMTGLPHPLLACVGCLIEGDADALEVARTFMLELGPYKDESKCPDSGARTIAAELGKLLEL